MAKINSDTLKNVSRAEQMLKYLLDEGEDDLSNWATETIGTIHMWILSVQEDLRSHRGT